MKPKNTPIELNTFAETKVNCQLVYSTQLGKIVSTQGVIRDILLQQDVEIAVLENGLPIPTRNTLSIQRMEG